MLLREARTPILLLLGALCFAEAFLCQRLEDNTWEGLVQALESSPEFVILCPPFDIRGGGCPSSSTGYVVPTNSSLTILCDQIAFGGGNSAHAVYKEGQITNQEEQPTSIMGCVVDCPGTHFTVKSNARLTLDGFTLRGSTRPAIEIEANGELHVFESKFENNSFFTGNGGAIQANENAKLIVNQCEFTNNTSLNGGAIFVEGRGSLSFSKFVDNKSLGTTELSGGGAIAIGMFADTRITGCDFNDNAAANGNGAAIFDHSSGANINSQGNRGCSNTQTGGKKASCNGIQKADPEGSECCQEFDVSCAIAANEGNHSRTAENVSTAPAAVDPNSTLMPTQDPCRDDRESFECVLHELLEGLP